MVNKAEMNSTLYLREPLPSDETAFLSAMIKSQEFHHPWIQAPLTKQEFQNYLARYQQPNHKSYLVCIDEHIIGVFNLNEIVRGAFQSAYLGFYAVAAYAKKGYMSAALKLILEQAFTTLQLHRLEANIQPQNVNSINLIKANHFRKEGYSPRYLKINGEWKDHERWAITLED